MIPHNKFRLCRVGTQHKIICLKRDEIIESCRVISGYTINDVKVMISCQKKDFNDPFD